MKNQYEITKVIEQYSNTLFKIAYSYTKSKTISEDILQDVFLKYLQTNKPFTDEEHLKAWLIRVSINECKKYFRSFWQSKRVPLDDIYSLELPEDHDVFFAVMDLPTKYRTVIHLFYYENYSIKEISTLLNKKQNTVLSLLHRARKLLKIDMETNYGYKTI